MVNSANHPSCFGPIKWAYLHNLALGYTSQPSEDDVILYNQHLELFIKGLKCAKCNKHALAYIEQNPYILTSREDFFRWTVDFHNTVNERLGKPQFSYEDAISMYSCTKSDEHDLIIPIVCATFLILVAVVVTIRLRNNNGN
jgi:hypothetical protein